MICGPSPFPLPFRVCEGEHPIPRVLYIWIDDGLAPNGKGASELAREE